MLKLKTSRGSELAGEASFEQPKQKLLIVDDEESLLAMLVSLFDDFYAIRSATSGAEALQILKEGFVPEVILADQRMPGMSGAEFLAQSTQYVPKAIRVILTGYTDVNDIIDSINLGNVYRFLTKPWKNAELLEAIRLCFSHYAVTTHNAELAEALARLAELNNEKNEMMGILAHDLKNPLTAIQMASSMLSEPEALDHTETRNFAGVINNSSQRMMELIKNLLDVNQIERGGRTFDSKPFNIAFLAQAAVGDYKTRAEAKQLTLEYSSEAVINALADEAATMQVLDNLVSNAVKYSPHGTTIYVRVQATSAGMARVEVQDEGPGLSAEDMSKLFGKFARLTAQPTGGEHSTGLGLSIVKKMVEAMHGTVWCESEIGKGATFIVELPLSK